MLKGVSSFFFVGRLRSDPRQREDSADFTARRVEAYCDRDIHSDHQWEIYGMNRL